MSTQVKRFFTAASHIILSHASTAKRVADTTSLGVVEPQGHVRFSHHPMLSLYRSMVSRIVGLPARRPATCEYISSNFGRIVSVQVFMHAAVICFAPAIAPSRVSHWVAPSQGSSSTLNGTSLNPIPTMMASPSATDAWVEGFLRSSSNPCSRSPVCFDRFFGVTG
jgi:hypothetical protein